MRWLRSRRKRLSALAITGLIVLLSCCLTSAQESETTAAPGPGRSRTFLRSTRDKTLQPSYIREYLQEQPPITTRQLSACMGGAPGSSAAVDTQYSSRSPMTNLEWASKIPIDIWNGNNDTDVSPTHALLAFNRLAEATNSAKVAADEIFLRRTAGPSRATI